MHAGDRAPQNDRDERVAVPTDRDKFQQTATAMQVDTRRSWAASILYKREEVWSMSCEWLGVCRR
jgi:hypothetical protein